MRFLGTVKVSDPRKLGRSIEIEVADGASAVCTFTNTFTASDDDLSSSGDAQEARLQIVKTVTGDVRTEPATFSFARSYAAAESLTIATTAASASGTTETLAPGTFTITEANLPTNYTLQGASCDGATEATLSGTTLSVTLADGDDAVCTFTNAFAAPETPEARLQIVKAVTGDVRTQPATFSFNRSYGTSEDLLIAAADTSASGATETLTPGTFTITEANLPANYALEDASCSGATDASLSGTTLTVTLADGDDAVCTFTNSFDAPEASLQIVKAVKGDMRTEPATFSFNRSYGADEDLTVAAAEMSASGASETLTPGTFTITEANLPANYALQDASCSGATDATLSDTTLTVTLADGDNAVCTFTNTFDAPEVNLQIVKAVTGDVRTEDAAFSFTRSYGADEILTIATTATSESGATETLTPGTFTITEASLPANYTLQGATCSGATDAALSGTTLTVELSDGDDAVCTFTNTYTAPVAPGCWTMTLIGATVPPEGFFDMAVLGSTGFERDIIVAEGAEVAVRLCDITDPTSTSEQVQVRIDGPQTVLIQCNPEPDFGTFIDQDSMGNEGFRNIVRYQDLDATAAPAIECLLFDPDQ